MKCFLCIRCQLRMLLPVLCTLHGILSWNYYELLSHDFLARQRLSIRCDNGEHGPSTGIIGYVFSPGISKSDALLDDRARP